MNCTLFFKGRRALALMVIALGILFSTFSATAQIPKDILVVGQIAEPKSLDPQVDTAVNDFRILVNIYDGLVRFKSGSLEVEPALAKSWTINKAGTVYTFHLRQGVKFQDGTAFNAQAVKFDFERMLDEKNPYHNTGPFPLAFFFSAVKQIKVVDDLTIQFVLDKPYAPFLANLAYPTGLIVSPSAVKKYGKDFGRHPVGTGPFAFKSWQANSKVELVRNEHYWDGKAKSKMVIFRPITDENTRVAEMMSGNLDIMPEVPVNSLSVFKSDDYKLYEQVGPHLWFLILNTRHGVFKDKRVRQAINYAINKKSLVNDVLNGTATVAAGPIPKAFSWAYNDKLQPYPYNPDKARKLIKEAGASGKTLTFYVTNGGSGMLDPVAMATAIQADLKAVGLNVKIQTYEWNTFLGKVNAGLKENADMAEMAWMTNDPDTLPYLTLRSAAFPDKGGFNSGYYSNPKVDKLLAQARASTDQATRAKLYKKMQVIVQKDAPWAFIASWKQNAVTSASVQNFHLEPSFLLLLKNVYKK